MHPTRTFADDKLSLKNFSETLESFLSVEHDFVEGSLVIGLNAPFGSGKTTFLSMWKADMESRKSNGQVAPEIISLNAWEDDFCGDPLLSIVTAFVNATPNSESQNTAETKK